MATPYQGTAEIIVDEIMSLLETRLSDISRDTVASDHGPPDPDAFSNAVMQALQARLAHRKVLRLLRGQNDRVPINRLPVEICTSIFSWCMTTFRTQNHRDYAIMRQTLTSVSHQWRRRIHATPEFWTRVSRSTPEPSLRTEISRSRPLSLSVDATDPCLDPRTPSTEMEFWLAIPFGVCRSIVAFSYPLFVAFLGVGSARLVNLEVQGNDPNGTGTWKSIKLPTASRLCNLATLALYDLELAGDKTLRSYRLVALRLRHVKGCAVADILGVIANSPMLEELSIANWDAKVTGEDEPVCTPLVSLRSLRLWNIDRVVIPLLLNAMEAHTMSSVSINGGLQATNIPDYLWDYARRSTHVTPSTVTLLLPSLPSFSVKSATFHLGSFPMSDLERSVERLYAEDANRLEVDAGDFYGRGDDLRAALCCMESRRPIQAVTVHLKHFGVLIAWMSEKGSRGWRGSHIDTIVLDARWERRWKILLDLDNKIQGWIDRWRSEAPRLKALLYVEYESGEHIEDIEDVLKPFADAVDGCVLGRR